MTRRPPARVWVAWCTGCGGYFGSGTSRGRAISDACVIGHPGECKNGPRCHDARMGVDKYILAPTKGKKR